MCPGTFSRRARVLQQHDPFHADAHSHGVFCVIRKEFSYYARILPLYHYIIFSRIFGRLRQVLNKNMPRMMHEKGPDSSGPCNFSILLVCTSDAVRIRTLLVLLVYFLIRFLLSGRQALAAACADCVHEAGRSSPGPLHPRRSRSECSGPAAHR